MTPQIVDTTRDVVVVAGPDAATYLQGQLSQDVLALQVGEAAWTFVLAPQGKVEAWGRLTRTAEDSYRLDVDAGAGAGLLARLQRFLMRTKASVELTESVPVCSVRGRELPSQAGSPWVSASWGQVPGSDLIGCASDDIEVPDGLTVGGVNTLESARIRSGMPRWGREIGQDTIPASLGQEVIDRSVSFTKGCYTGQELVARMDARGNLMPTRILRVTLEGPAPAAGALLMSGDDTVGTITSAADLGPGAVALASVPRRVEPPLAVTVDGIAAQLTDLTAP